MSYLKELSEFIGAKSGVVITGGLGRGKQGVLGDGHQVSMK